MLIRNIYPFANPERSARDARIERESKDPGNFTFAMPLQGLYSNCLENPGNIRASQSPSALAIGLQFSGWGL